MTASTLLTDSVTSAVNQAATPKVDQMYQTFGESAREFVNKNFYNSYELIRPFFDDITAKGAQVNGATVSDPANPHNIPLSLWIKVWSLYLAILDASCKQAGEALLNSTGDLSGSDSGEWNQTRKQLARKLTSGSIWDELVTASGGTGNIHPTILALLASLSIRHDTDAKLMADNMEKFIVSYNDNGSDDPKTKTAFYKVLDLYLLRVLPDLRQWDVAHSFVDNTNLFSHEQKKEMTHKLEESQKHAEQEHKRLLHEAQEKEKSDAKEKEREERVSRDTKSRAVTSDSSVTSDSARETTKTRDITRDLSKSARQPRTLSQIISTSFKSQFDGNAIFRTLALVVIISLSAANPLIRKRVVDTLRMLWIKILQTLSMGFKVSYL
ncbi:hypothetical protein CJU90_5255 [Yarrowia sp. C11]|nr:hypothetical protein CJU90_5255 [Yarrowia sp. C11]